MSNLKIPRSSSDVALDSRGRVYHFIKEHLHHFIPKIQPGKGSRIHGSRNAHRSGFEEDISSDNGSALLKRSRSVGPGLARPVQRHCDNPGENGNSEGWASVFSKTKGIWCHLSLTNKKDISSGDFTVHATTVEKAGELDWAYATSASSLNSTSPDSNLYESHNFQNNKGSGEEMNTSVNLGTFGEDQIDDFLSVPHTGSFSVNKQMLDETLHISDSEDHSFLSNNPSTGVARTDLGSNYLYNSENGAAISDRNDLTDEPETSDQTAVPDTNKQRAGIETVDQTVAPDILTFSTPSVSDSTQSIYVPNYIDPFMNQPLNPMSSAPRARRATSKKSHKLQKKKKISTSQLQAMRSSKGLRKGPVVASAQERGEMEAGVKELGHPGDICTYPFNLFGIPSSRKGFKDFEDCLIFKHLTHIQKLKPNPVLYFKWWLWLEDDDSNQLAEAKVLDNEELLKRINKIIQGSCSGDIAYLRQGLHPNRRCGKVALQVKIEKARELFCELSTMILCEHIYISVPLEVEIPVIGIDLHESPFGYVVIKIWLCPAFNSRNPLLDQVSCLVNCLLFLVSEEFVSIFETAVYVDEQSESLPLEKFIYTL